MIFTSLPQLADIVAVLAVCVGAGVCTGAGVEGANHGIGDIGAGGLSARERKYTADSE